MRDTVNLKRAAGTASAMAGSASTSLQPSELCPDAQRWTACSLISDHCFPCSTETPKLASATGSSLVERDIRQQSLHEAAQRFLSGCSTTRTATEKRLHGNRCA